MKYIKQAILIAIILISSISIFANPTASNTQLGSFSIANVNVEATKSVNIRPITETIDLRNQLSEYIIFPESKSSLNYLASSLTNVKKIYPNIYAIRFDAYPSDIIGLESKYQGRIAPARVFNDISIGLPEKPIKASNSIGLDGDIDANFLHVKEMWDMGYNGTGVVVAEHDTGIKFSHPALVGQQYGTQQNFNVQPDNTTGPICQDHGTWVAGTIAGTGADVPENKGMAFGAKIHSLAWGCGDEGALIGDPIAAFDYLATLNDTLNVVNMSWSSNFGSFYSPAINRLADLNILAVVSAGNSGPNTFTIGSPSSAVSALTVGATDYNGKITSFSSRGPVDGNLIKPDVVAPGLRVLTTDQGGGYVEVSGTSFSSPLTTGAIAVLISALNQNNIPWNIGTLKTAIMRGATSGGDELTFGQGIVNLQASWNYLNSVTQDSNGPMVVEMTPKQGPISFFNTMPSGITTEFPFTLVTSHPQNVSVSISGDLASFTTIRSINDTKYSQAVNLQFNTTGIAVGTYTGILNATVGSDWVTSSWQITVNGPVKAKALMAQSHTYWDELGQDKIGGSNTGEMVRIAIKNNVWVEETSELITDALLSNYEILWLPDSFPMFSSEDFPADPLLQSEINAIVNFVDNGGSLFIDFNGITTDKTTGDVVGTNATEVNRLLSNFDITTSTDPSNYLEGPVGLNLINSSFPVGSAKRISHAGNFLNVGPNATPLTMTDKGATIAIWDQPGKGRVLVTSSNFWLDNFGAVGLYNGAGGDDDVIFSQNTWKWLSSSKRIHKISSIINDSQISAEFQITIDGVNSTDTPIVNLVKNDLVDYQSIIPTRSGDNYKIDYSITHDGIFQIQAVYGDEYLLWESIVDNKGPQISVLSVNENATGWPEGKDLFFKFSIVDSIDQTLTKNNIWFELNGENSSLITHSYRDDIQVTTVSIKSSLVNKTGVWYILSVHSLDNKGNKERLDFYFYVGDVNPDIETTSESVTTSSTNQITTTHPPETTPTTASTTSSKTKSSPISIYVIISSILIVSQITITIKRKKR